MLFSSLTFVWFFLPALALIYYISPGRKLKNGVLLIASLVFYSWGEPRYVVLVILSILLNYGFGLALDGCGERRGLKKAVFVLSILADLGLLGYFKYFNFFLELAMSLLGRQGFYFYELQQKNEKGLTMEHTAKVLTSYEEQLNNAASILPAPAENICFFDIETTGLSAAVSSLYLIGTITFENNEWVLNQWFADDYVSEVRLLQAFSEFSEKYEWIAHYNGATFDIPYLEKKYRTNHMPSPFAGKQTLDLYRAVKHIKKYFPVPNQKLIRNGHMAEKIFQP